VPNVAIFYNAADLLVFPSYYEGFGYPIAEAMASGCPVVAADSSSIPEVVGTTGILFPPSDMTRLYETVIQVLTDSTMRSKMIEDGFKQCLKFDWEICARTTLKAYEALNP
jgi:glycosyltransferase involved in cell wall biosynthesis